MTDPTWDAVVIVTLMAWTCPFCGTVYSDGITYCRQCAAKN